MCSRHRPRVRFPAPAPIFFILVMICLCGSAGAVDFDDNTMYKINDFAFWGSDSGTPAGGRGTYFPAGSDYSVTNISYGAACTVCVADSSGSGATGYYLDYFDLPSQDIRFIHLRLKVPRAGSAVGYVADRDIRGYILVANSSAVKATGIECYGYISDASTGSVDYVGSENYCVRYDSIVEFTTDFIIYDMYYCLRSDYFLVGVGGRVSRHNSERVIPFDFDYVTFEVSSTAFTSGSGGSGGCDVSGLTSQINSLSSQMTSSFQEVNSNIDVAESSISQSISNQTSSLESAIDSAVDESNQHFDDWDSSLSGAFNSSDAQIVVDTNTAVSGVHQFEEDQVEDTQSAIDDVGLDGYSIPSDISNSFSEFGTILGLLFNSFGFVTPLIIFSCTFGIAFVLIGRKSRGSE